MSEQPETVTCPRCLGSSKEGVLVNRSPRGAYDHDACQWENWDCPECDGQGHVTAAEFADYQERVRKGWEMQGERVAKRIPLRDAARERGMTPVELSELERGEKPR